MVDYIYFSLYRVQTQKGGAKGLKKEEKDI